MCFWYCESHETGKLIVCSSYTPFPSLLHSYHCFLLLLLSTFSPFSLSFLINFSFIYLTLHVFYFLYLFSFPFNSIHVCSLYFLVIHVTTIYSFISIFIFFLLCSLDLAKHIPVPSGPLCCVFNRQVMVDYLRTCHPTSLYLSVSRQNSSVS